MTADEELREAVRIAVWDPIEPLFVAIARFVTRWLI